LAARAAEAIEVGAAFDLKPPDIIAPGPRQATLQFVTGVPPRKPISIAKVSPDAATASAQIGIATGLALAAPRQGKSRVTIALTASLALTDETWKATMKFAVAEKIAIIYLVETGSGKENNQLFRMAAQQCGLPAITVDGDDAVAVYRVMQECMRRARQGHGPAVLECITGNTDPLRFMEGYLKKRNLWSDQWKHSVAATAARDLAKTSRLYAK
jgi:pyruvate dehydrogenase E1 component alpha subunit